jgi:hypothetical protein
METSEQRTTINVVEECLEEYKFIHKWVAIPYGSSVLTLNCKILNLCIVLIDAKVEYLQISKYIEINNKITYINLTYIEKGVDVHVDIAYYKKLTELKVSLFEFLYEKVYRTHHRQPPAS